MIFLLAKSHMHIFIMLIISVQSFKLIACKPWEEFITQTCYSTLKANLKTVLSRKCHKFVKNYIFVFKNSHAHLQYIFMLITSVQSFKLIACKPWEELITQTCYPTLKANLKTVISRKCCNFVKNYFFVCKNSYAHLQYIHNKYA